MREADAFGKGDVVNVAALLRREGLYSSQLSSWRRQRDEVAKEGNAVEKARPEGKGRGSTGQGARARRTPGSNVAWLAWRRCWRSKKKPPNYWGSP